MAVPSETEPSRNVTCPPGVPDPELGATVADRIAVVPNAKARDGATERATADPISGAALSAIDSAAELDPVNRDSPRKLAEMECVPIDRAEVVNVARPEPSRTTAPISAEPSKKPAAPDGTPEPFPDGNTFATNVRDWPTIVEPEDVRLVVVADGPTETARIAKAALFEPSPE